MNPPIEIFDGRAVPCSVKHGQILEKWCNLPVGHSFILINDHNPVRMQEQFAAQWPGAFAWEYLVNGPSEFRIKITRLTAATESAVPVATSCSDH